MESTPDTKINKDVKNILESLKEVVQQDGGNLMVIYCKDSKDDCHEVESVLMLEGNPSDMAEALYHHSTINENLKGIITVANKLETIREEFGDK